MEEKKRRGSAPCCHDGSAQIPKENIEKEEGLPVMRKEPMLLVFGGKKDPNPSRFSDQRGKKGVLGEEESCWMVEAQL